MGEFVVLDAQQLAVLRESNDARRQALAARGAVIPGGAYLDVALGVLVNMLYPDASPERAEYETRYQQAVAAMLGVVEDGVAKAVAEANRPKLVVPSPNMRRN